MLRMTVLASALALTLSTGANAIEFADEGAPLSPVAAVAAGGETAVVAWSAGPGPGFLATEGGYSRIATAPAARSSGAVQVSSLPAAGFFADESGYIRSVGADAEMTSFR